MDVTGYQLYKHDNKRYNIRAEDVIKARKNWNKNGTSLDQAQRFFCKERALVTHI